MTYDSIDLYDIIDQCKTIPDLQKTEDWIGENEKEYPLAVFWTLKEYISVRKLEINLFKPNQDEDETHNN